MLLTTNFNTPTLGIARFNNSCINHKEDEVPEISVLLNMQEVSDITRIPVPTLRYYRHMKKGPASALIGGKVRYREEDVRKWIEAQFEDGEE